MATAALYNAFRKAMIDAALLGGSISGTLKLALLADTYTPDVDADDFFDDVVADEVSGTGYSAGGATIGGATSGQDNTNDRGYFDANDVSWAGSTITARYAVLYFDTGTDSTSRLVCYVDFGSNQSTSGTTFAVNWDNTSQILRV